MKKFKPGLFLKVLAAIAGGALLGLVAPEFLVRIFKTFNVLFAQLLKFIIPLLILGLVTPAIAHVGKGAGKMLLTVMGIAYLSTICAGFFAHVCGSNLLPLYLTAGELSGDAATAKEFLPYIDLKIPPICDVLTALRNKCGMPMLECKVNPLFVKKNDVLYSPDQKYNAMLERNPAIAGLRKLFPNIDY